MRLARPSGPVGQRRRLGAAARTVTGSREDLLEAVVADDRPGQLGQDPADEPHRPGQQPEQRHEPDQVAERDRHRSTRATIRRRAAALDRHRRAARPARPRTSPGRTRRDPLVAQRARPSRPAASVSASSRPSVFTTSAPSIDSCATARTSPIRSCARCAGSSMRRAKMRFMSGERREHEQRRRAPATGRPCSSAISASTVSRITPDREGHRPEDVDRGLHVGLHVGEQLAGRASRGGTAATASRYRSATRVRRVAMTRSPATPA